MSLWKKLPVWTGPKIPWVWCSVEANFWQSLAENWTNIKLCLQTNRLECCFTQSDLFYLHQLSLKCCARLFFLFNSGSELDWFKIGQTHSYVYVYFITYLNDEAPMMRTQDLNTEMQAMKCGYNEWLEYVSVVGNAGTVVVTIARSWFKSHLSTQGRDMGSKWVMGSSELKDFHLNGLLD